MNVLGKLSAFIFPGVKSKRTVYVVTGALLLAWLYVAWITKQLPPFDWSHLMFLAIIVGASGSSA